jgi:hypothetical protein
VDPADNSLQADSLPIQIPRGLLQLTGGALRPGSISSLSNSPATAMSYDQKLGAIGRILLAGQTSYERGFSGAFASIWLPSGTFERGPETTFVMRQGRTGPTGLAFQGMRVDHSEQIALTDRLSLHAGAEYLRIETVSSVSALHPHAQLDANLAPGWTASLLAVASPSDAGVGPTGALESAIAKLDSLPVALLRDGRPVLEGGWHQELSVKHKLTDRASLEAAAFHDASRHEAIVGSGPVASPDIFQDAFPNAFLYDGGKTSSWGARVAYRQKISDSLDFAAVYSWAGALSPVGELNAESSGLLNGLATRNHPSVAAQISGKLPVSGTQFAASYKWVSGATLTHSDAFGEAAYQIDPNLHVSIRQHIPCFRSSGRLEALADFSNLLAQGYMPVKGQDTRVVVAPVLRSFRGGLSFQF